MAINIDLLATDLDFLISQAGKELVGVTPAGITDLVFVGSFTTMEEGYEVMLQGNEVTIDCKIVLNGKAYSTLPTKGAVLKDRDSKYFKVMSIDKDDYGPSYTLNCAAQYQRGN